MPDTQPRVISRRALLQGAGALGTAAVAAVGSAGVSARAGTPAPEIEQSTSSTSSTAAPESYEHLTADEAELLESIADHLIPSDENGPGALEARAVRYIDRALGSALSSSHHAYRSGLAAFDRYCRSSRGGSFLELPHIDRISVLIDVETGAATGAGAGFVGSSAAFFGMVRRHVLQGTFGDPYYGGNANFVGWDLVGYPGVRTLVTREDQQRLEADDLPANHRSAYDWDNFNKATVQIMNKESRHGD